MHAMMSDLGCRSLPTGDRRTGDWGSTADCGAGIRVLVVIIGPQSRIDHINPMNNPTSFPNPQSVDPHWYDALMSESFEQWLAFIAAQLGDPVEREDRAAGETYFTGGDPGEVIVRLTRASVTVWEYAVRWDSAYTQIVTPRLIGSVRWRRVSERAAAKVVQTLIEAARESRRAKFRMCHQCEERQPPEWMQGRETCISCAQSRSGAVH